MAKCSMGKEDDCQHIADLLGNSRALPAPIFINIATKVGTKKCFLKGLQI